MKNEWKDAVIDALIVNHAYKQDHEFNPRKALADLITVECEIALDPLISKEAKDLMKLTRDEDKAEEAYRLLYAHGYEYIGGHWQH